MDGLTINEAAETTGWSPRMLRYIESAGLIEPPRTGVGLPHLRPGRAAAPAHAARAARPVRLRPLGRRVREAAARRARARATRSTAGSRNGPQRPEDVASADWLGYEQEKHQRLLATLSRDTARRTDRRMTVTETTHRRTTRSPTSASPTSAARRSRLAEHEMPGLMAMREEYGAAAAAQGRAHHGLAAHDGPDRRADRDARRARRRGALGSAATSSRPRTTPPRRSPRPASRSSPGRARRSRSTGGAPSRRSPGPASDGPNMILDDGGDATLLVHKGAEFEKAGAVPDPELGRVRGVQGHPARCSSARSRRTRSAGRALGRGIQGVTEETTTGVHRLYQMQPRRRRCCSRRSTSTTRSPSRSSTTSTAAATR